MEAGRRRLGRDRRAIRTGARAGRCDEAARFAALSTLDELGALAAADQLRKSLRAAGVRGIPRGARASTQTNSHQLTEREVLELLCAGLRNSEIAERLCRPVRTVDHHVAASFAKLGVDTRAEAIAAAARAGIAPQNR